MRGRRARWHRRAVVARARRLAISRPQRPVRTSPPATRSRSSRPVRRAAAAAAPAQGPPAAARRDSSSTWHGGSAGRSSRSPAMTILLGDRPDGSISDSRPHHRLAGRSVDARRSRRGHLLSRRDHQKRDRTQSSVIHPLTDDRRLLPLKKTGEIVEAAAGFQLVMAYNPGYQHGLKDSKPSTLAAVCRAGLRLPAPADGGGDRRPRGGIELRHGRRAGHAHQPPATARRQGPRGGAQHAADRRNRPAAGQSDPVGAPHGAAGTAHRRSGSSKSSDARP